MRRARRRANSGFTMFEVLVSSAIGAVIAGGTMTAFVTAARLVKDQDNPVKLEATSYAQQTIERFRNRIACTDPEWFNSVDCTSTLGVNDGADPTDNNVTGGIYDSPPGDISPASNQYWAADPLVDEFGAPYAVGSASILDADKDGTIDGKRCYRAWRADCDGVGGVGDCYALQVKVCWGAVGGCTC